MNRSEKITKLEALGIYQKWARNIIEFDNDTANQDFMDYRLEKDEPWSLFIKKSFKWDKTPEGHIFWEEVSRKEDTYVHKN